MSLNEAIGLADDATQPLSQPLASGERDAFDQLVRDHHQAVTRLAYRLLGWRGEVEDVIHDVFLAAFKKLHRFRGESSPWTWLATITINRCRSTRRRKFLPWRWLERQDRSFEESSSERIEQKETNQRVRDAVAKLPATDREVIVLFYLEEMSVSQISKMIGVKETAINVRLHRARKRLKELLGDE
jgi:RNA polymerase sigma-70 factor (ECF subfamily)